MCSTLHDYEINRMPDHVRGIILKCLAGPGYR